MKEGGVLGFPCQHCYVAVKEKLNNEEDLSVLLKGSDNAVSYTHLTLPTTPYV